MLIDEIKSILRVTSDDFDDEIDGLIAEAKHDLMLCGIAEDLIDEHDDLIKRAIKLYCKTYFGYENPDFDRLLASYQLFKSHLMVSEEYGADYVA